MALQRHTNFIFREKNHDLQISLSDVLVDNDELTALHRVIESDQFSMGSEVLQFEKILLNILAQSLL